MSITIPDDAVESPSRLMEAVVLALWSQGRLSSGKAGALLGLSRSDLWALASRRGAAWPYTQEDLQSDLAALKEIGPA